MPFKNYIALENAHLVQVACLLHVVVAGSGDPTLEDAHHVKIFQIVASFCARRVSNLDVRGILKTKKRIK